MVSFEAAYRQNYDTVFRWLFRRCRDAETAQDVTQDTFLMAWQIWDRSSEITNLRNWLIGIARRTFAHFRRAAAAQQRGPAETVEWNDTTDMRSIAPSQEDGLHFQDVIREIDKLGPAQQQVMRALATGETATEIAAARGASVASTTMAISLGRKRLKALIGESFFLPSLKFNYNVK